MRLLFAATIGFATAGCHRHPSQAEAEAAFSKFTEAYLPNLKSGMAMPGPWLELKLADTSPILYTLASASPPRVEQIGGQCTGIVRVTLQYTRGTTPGANPDASSSAVLMFRLNGARWEPPAVFPDANASTQPAGADWIQRAAINAYDQTKQ